MRLSDARIEGGRLSFAASPSEARKFVYGFKPGEYDIQPTKRKRSINANDFCWGLCTEIAKAVGIDKDTVYRDAIRHVGAYRDYHLPENEAENLMKDWQWLGTGWTCEKVDYDPDGKVLIRAYIGSSKYDTAQMSRLIDWLKQEAENLDIDVDDDRIKSLLKSWEAKA